MVRIENLTFAYPGQEPIFQDFNLEISAGEAWSIIGPSGCGKTSFLYLLAGLQQFAQGKIIINGEPVTRPRPGTGLVLQDHGLLPWATVKQNARLGLTIRKFYGPDGKHAPKDHRSNPQDAEEKVNYWLDWLGISHLQENYPSQLSRGQRQRAAIARTLVLEPDLLLLDEPFSALDAPIRIELQHVMVRFHKESELTSITVTHDIEEAVFLGRKILVIGNTCDRKPNIIENNLAGDIGFRSSDAFRKRCDFLKQLLGRRS